MNLYEFNQAGYAAIPAMTEPEIAGALVNIKKYISEHYGSYYMLLNKEKSYYTLFTWNRLTKPVDQLFAMSNELMSIVRELGTLKAIEVNEHGAIEFWVQSEEDCNMYVFFNYDTGVIEV